MPEELSPGLWRLGLGWPTPFAVNAYLLDHGSVTLIDTGYPRNSTDIRHEIVATGHRVTDIDRVFVTHYDLDHIGGLSRLVPDLSAPVYVGQADLSLIQGIDGPPLINHKGLFHRGLRALYRLPESLSFNPVHDQDVIDGFIAFHTPGHNPGHTVFIHEALGIGFLGDLVWESEGELTTPIWFDSYDMGELRASVRRLATEVPSFEIACMGHGQPLLTGGYEALRVLAKTC